MSGLKTKLLHSCTSCEYQQTWNNLQRKIGSNCNQNIVNTNIDIQCKLTLNENSLKYSEMTYSVRQPEPPAPFSRDMCQAAQAPWLLWQKARYHSSNLNGAGAAGPGIIGPGEMNAPHSKY